MDIIEYEICGKKFTAREIEVALDGKTETLIIGNWSFNDYIDEHYNDRDLIGILCREIDEDIYCYVKDEDFDKPDDELAKMIQTYFS